MVAIKRVVEITAVIIFLLFALIIGRMIFLSLTSKVPEVKLQDGKLRPCPQTPNCVSSEALQSSKKILPFEFTSTPEAAWKKLKNDVEKTGGQIMLQQQKYMWATYNSRIFRFVDDIEFRMLPEDQIIHVRSGSRVGKSDIGVNRKTVEKIRKQFNSAN